MSRVAKVLSSSIGKKFVMGITGLLLCGFLVGHLGGNFLIYLGPDWINAYATKLHALGPILILIEIGLAAIFVVHIVMAYKLTAEYRAARPKEYEKKETKQEKSVWWKAPNTWMVISGTIALAFLILHMIDMRYGWRPVVDPTFGGYNEHGGWHNEPTEEHPVVHVYNRTISILQTPLSAILYTLGVIFIGFHLSHGFQSGFRSLGFAHPVYSKALSWLGNAFAIVVTVGFASFPVWVWAFGIEPIPLEEGPHSAASASAEEIEESILSRSAAAGSTIADSSPAGSTSDAGAE
ncbi:succinate dehydrogenase cytochrome b subunit [Stratiformator vulcanicus]|uniref:Succinate dehydrogenase/Fumarate reductase transmembrane subunit n=1 Tax=Stratiformator vulcanicus TaxID=2527980 RepID=A0A517R5H9_9PLAN|nr:succinate dehydrogenase cytochrome b subunit [Stratiformator vulcanicus]QDT39156.1 hypothetical protein Pan189_35590 [Stratiformator vulcanicus]